MKSCCLQNFSGGGGRGCREKNAIYKAISAATESAIIQNYFPKFGLYSVLWRKGSMGTLLPIKPDTEAGVSHTKGEGPPRCSSRLELGKIISRASQLSGTSWRKPHQRFHSSHFLLLNFKAHIYVPQVAHEPRHVKQFGVDGRGTFSRPGTFENTISSSVSPPSDCSWMLPWDEYS